MKVKANAKVNLSLDITGKRQDGYHTLSSVMQSVNLGDIITIDKAETITVACDNELLSGEDNLCFKAAQLFFERSKAIGGAHIFIEKHIPVAGGLGGGSADAAAVLTALNKMYGEPLSNDELLSMALSLGADVPFCVNGGTALAEGIGEELSSLPNLPDCVMVIAKKGTKSSTRDMYSKIDSAEPLKISDIDNVLFSLLNGDLESMCKGLYNRFEEVVDGDVLQECKSVMADCGCLYAGLSGAGPSVVGIFRECDSNNASEAVSRLKGKGFFAAVCKPAAVGVEIFE